MAILAPVEAARDSRRAIVSNGVAAHLTTFIGANRYNPSAASAEPPGPEAVYPVAFLVEQPAGSVVASHFHEANQFQIVVAGHGTLGSHPVEPVAVHYSNAFSAYGPITAGPAGLQYFTLRNGYDRGARYLPAAREEMRGVKRRFRDAFAGPVAPDAAVPEEGTSTVLIPEAADGMGAWRLRLPPGAPLEGLDPASGDGQFWVVTAGSLHASAGEILPPLSCIFVAPDEPSFAAAAGETGLEVVMVQFPCGRDHVVAKR
ncbi:hypothetical protein [Belnapia sp. F-4-1]|uniref:hypothetical protein n=1 Tax=Belnapia sp. F-4-1 TaxID=1545443 RepID=UPI0005B7ABDC|nr:hypothetical protein [Belnapia sp. F-4-1]